jgi:penicillin-insensitive murein endopeptidase
MAGNSRTARLRTACLCGIACLLIAAPAATQAPRAPLVLREVSLRPPNAERSRSIGLPWEGHLLRGLALRESKYIRKLPECAGARRFYGTWQLVQLINRATRRVWSRYAGSRLSIGELSGKDGGDIDGHGSHESGRDADVGFYLLGADGRPTLRPAFVQMDNNGRGVAPNEDVRFDVARNWELVSKLVDDSDARVQYIFVGSRLRKLLLREAARRKAPASVIDRASSVLMQPSHGNPHRSHFHVRIYCPPTDRPQCLDVAPFWPWYPGAEGVIGVAPRKTEHSPALASPLSAPLE